MPETPERDIEKQLRQHAERRRAAAGDPSLHPATRRLLQTEVRRFWGGRRVDHAKAGGWQRFWPRLAFALGVLTMLGTAAVLWLGPGEKAPMNFAKLEQTSPTASALPVAAPAADPIVADSAFTTLERDGSGRLADDSTVMGGARRVDQGSSYAAAEPLAANSLAPVAERLFYAGTALAKKADLKSSDERAQSIAAASGAPVKEATGSKPQSFARFQADQQAPGVTQSFRNVALTEGEQPKRNAVLPVLGNFTVAQNGNELTMVDEDGSVYKGTAELAPPVIIASQTESSDAALAEIRPATGLAAKDELARRTETKAAPIPSNALKVEMAAHQAPAMVVGESLNWQFKVAGTNRSLQQRVVFTGNLIQNTFNRPAEDRSRQVYQQVPAAQNQIRNNNQSQLAPPNNFITGRVVLDNRKETELNALSVEPK